MAKHDDQRVALATHLGKRHDAILAAWRRRVSGDPKLTSGAALPRTQLHDHIPALLEDFERRLRATDAPARAAAESEQKGDAAAHGLHRWQQGFDLSEVTRELGRLNECVVAELDALPGADPALEPATMADARRIWAELYSIAVSTSASQYFKLEQLEVSGHLSDLEQALASLRDLERERGVLWQQAAHDLRGNLGVVVMATAGLTSDRASADMRERFLASLDRNVRALHRLLEDVTSLARLQGGQEVRRLADMDASQLLLDLADGMQAMAQERQLFLKFDGPPSFPVVGDAIKTRRIVQNLLLNAIKYTRRGGVSVTWGSNPAGSDAARWFIQIEDTGPGLDRGPNAPLTSALGTATALAKESAASAVNGDVTHIERERSALPSPRAGTESAPAQPGEGIGLSIVKRLCTLLDATLEVDSRPGIGTRFRILLPRRYEG